MSIYDELKSDHQKVKELLSQLAETSRAAAKERLFEELKTALTAHSRAEEKVFYDAIKTNKTAKDAALEGYEEHHIVDVLMREISRLAPSDERWKAKFTVLKENIEHHVEEEEGEIFAKAREILSDEQAEALGEKFAADRSKRLAKAA